MRRQIVGIAFLGFAVVMGSAVADECKETATVSGSVNTTNISDTIQIGTVKLNLESDKNGREVFDEFGGIVGRVIESTPETGTSVLNHSLFFEDGTRVETQGDVAQILYPITACSFAVTETISNYVGSGVFKGATGNIVAEGTVSVPPCKNENSFTLSGTVCIK